MVLAVAVMVFGLSSVILSEEHPKTAPAEVTVKGEVIDFVCYLDHQGMGEKHAACAKTCMEGGMPAGIRGEDGKIYLVVGEHKSINAQLAPLAAKTVTVKGKLVSRDGVNMIENAQIVTQ